MQCNVARKLAGTVVSALRNTPSHTSFVVQQFLAKQNSPVITPPSYALDLTLSDFCLFSTLKMGLKGTSFIIMENINSNV
jgi:hypothetical protein